VRREAEERREAERAAREGAAYKPAEERAREARDAKAETEVGAAYRYIYALEKHKPALAAEH
jgi:hypothetical protein